MSDSITSEDNRVYDNILGAIGNTPLVRLNKVSRGLKCELWGKCEYLNAGGSVKDRIGRQMILDMQTNGQIKPGDTLIEPTSGNTGIGLSLAAAALDYKMIITLPKKMSQEKVAVLEGLGAKVIRTPTEAAWDAPDSHIGVARRLNLELPNSHIPDQYTNPSNPKAHYDGTAEEIIRQTGGKLDMIVMTAGTGGTLAGIAKKIKEKLPHVQIVGVDPVGSILAGEGPIHSYQVEGIGYDFIPDVMKDVKVDRWIRSRDPESFVMARRLIREEGLLCGGSSGTAVWAALEAAKDLKEGQRCVVLLPDSVRNYMTKFLDDRWMYDYGFSEPPRSIFDGPTVQDLALGNAFTIQPTASVCDAIKLLKSNGENTIAIVDSDAVFHGLVTSRGLINYVLDGGDKSVAVTEAKQAIIREIEQSTPLNRARYSVAKNEGVVAVIDSSSGKKQFKGLLTDKDIFAYFVSKQ